LLELVQRFDCGLIATTFYGSINASRLSAEWTSAQADVLEASLRVGVILNAILIIIAVKGVDGLILREVLG